MDRKTLFYNVMQDMWKVVSCPQANKKKEEMTEDDWKFVVSSFSTLYEKYKKLPPEQSKFFFEISDAFINLIDRENKLITTE